MKKFISMLSVICLTIALLAGCSINNIAGLIHKMPGTETAKDTFADLVVYGTVYTAEDESDGLAEAFADKDVKYIYSSSYVLL